MPVGSVKGATPSTSALNARPNIPPVNVMSPQPSSALTLANSDRQLLLLLLGSQLVMPVKVDWLESLLAGYSLPLKSPFRIIPVHPLEYPLLGIKWDNQYYFDRCLAMGLKSSCAIFETFSSSLEWLATQYLHASAVIHILDDFLFIAPTKDKCSTDLHNFLAMRKVLGVPIAHEKTAGPNTTLQFAGIELDCVRLEARLPLDKLTKSRTLLHQYYKKRSVTLRELQSLIGLLNFGCSVVVPGCAFLRHLIDLTSGLTHPHHHIRLNQEAKQEIRMWFTFLDSFNGREFFVR